MNTNTATPKESNAAKEKTGGGWMRRLVLRWLAIPIEPKLIATIHCAEGDTLIFKISGHPSFSAMMKSLHAGLSEAFPKQKIIVLPGHVALHAAISQNDNR